jgi:hypothetical protein
MAESVALSTAEDVAGAAVGAAGLAADAWLGRATTPAPETGTGPAPG